jgi:hypothetical protein
VKGFSGEGKKNVVSCISEGKGKGGSKGGQGEVKGYERFGL